MPFSALTLVLLLLGGLALGLGAAWLNRVRPWRGPRTRYPVVLVHGFLGFDDLAIGGSRQNYFRGIVEHLESLGVKVYRPRLPALGSVAQRAQALADHLRSVPARKVNLVAHSMGGVDARFAISCLGCRKRVASLTTIATPHRGTPLADLGNALIGENGLGRLLSLVGLGVGALADLNTKAMESFNRKVRDVPGVRYASVIATAKKDGSVHPLLATTHKLLSMKVGENDGIVPRVSQDWGTVVKEIEADHWAEIGWSDGFDAPRLYEELVTRLRRQGL
jgi:triacylglycerol lipase